MNDPAANRPWLPYVAPMATYMTFMLLQETSNMLWVYPIKVTTVGLLLWVFHNRYEELRPNLSSIPLAVLVGLVAIAIWIWIDPYYPKMGAKGDVFNPSGLWVFIGFRVVGAVIIVPLMEELFWRGFLVRWLIDEDFKKVPVGVYTLPAFAITTVLFSLEHREWLAGLFCGALYNWLCYKRRNLFACVVAHAVSNAALAAWVLWRGDWKFW